MSTKKKVKTNGDYRKNVLDVNARLKESAASVGGAMRRLMLFEREIGMNADFKKVMNKAIKGSNNNAVYSKIAKEVRKTKRGTCPFYVLQYVNKNLPDLLTLAGYKTKIAEAPKPKAKPKAKAKAKATA